MSNPNLPVSKVRRSGNPNPQGNKGKGRKPGIPNKVTKALKDMILGALDDAGGQAYLQEQANKNPGPFLSLIGKVLPMDVRVGDPDGKPIVINILPVKPRD